MSSSNPLWRARCGCGCCRRWAEWATGQQPVVPRRQGNVGHFRLHVHVPIDDLSIRLEASHSTFQSSACHLILLSTAKPLLPLVSGRGLQDVLFDLLQRRLAARLSDRTQVDVPRRNSVVVISGGVPVCAFGCFQAVICIGCCWIHAGDVPVISACFWDLSPDRGSVTHVWL